MDKNIKLTYNGTTLSSNNIKKNCGKSVITTIDVKSKLNYSSYRTL